MAQWFESLELAEKCWSASDPPYPDALADEGFYPHLALKLGLTKVRANLQWCEESIELIKARKSRQKSASRYRQNLDFLRISNRYSAAEKSLVLSEDCVSA